MQFPKRLLPSLILAGLYFLAARLGLRLAIVQANATAIWPPSGLALAAMLLAGPQIWPGVFLGAFAVNLATQGTVLTSLAIGIGNTFEAVIAATMVRRHLGDVRVFDHPFTVFRYIPIVAFSAAVSATIGTTSLSGAGFSPLERLHEVWFTWWLGDVSSLITITPFLVVWFMPGRPRFRGRIIEGIGLALITLLLSAWLFTPELNSRGYPFLYVMLPPLIWVSFRFGQRGATFFILVLVAYGLYGTHLNSGPFAGFPPNKALLLLQGFITTFAVTGLFLTSTLRVQRNVEQALRASQEKYMAVNRELEQFAFASSHDLKEPLRKITAYAELLEEKIGGTFDDSTRRFMNVIISGAHRMQALIDGLLEYSRLNDSRGELKIINAHEVCVQVQADLETIIRDVKGRVTYGQLPTIRANPLQFRRLLQNLITNGLKFRREEAPHVHITGVAISGGWEFTVRDNGIGIDPVNRETIFNLFTRLNSASKYPGSGIGLATCKKIVESHDGRIWFESTPGVGTTFHFTLKTESDAHRPSRRAGEHSSVG